MDAYHELSNELEDLIDDALAEIKDGQLGKATRQALADQLIEDLDLAVDDVDGIEKALRETLKASDGETTLQQGFETLLRLVEEIEREDPMDIDVALEILDEEALKVLEKTLSLFLDRHGPMTLDYERMWAETDGMICELDTYEFYAVRSEPEGSKEEWRESVPDDRIAEVFETAQDRDYDYYEHCDADPERVFEAIEAIIREQGCLEVAHFEPDEQIVELDAQDVLKAVLPDADVEVVVNDQGVFIDRTDEDRETLSAIRWNDIL